MWLNMVWYKLRVQVAHNSYTPSPPLPPLGLHHITILILSFGSLLLPQTTNSYPPTTTLNCSKAYGESKMPRQKEVNPEGVEDGAIRGYISDRGHGSRNIIEPKKNQHMLFYNVRLMPVVVCMI